MRFRREQDNRGSVAVRDREEERFTRDDTVARRRGAGLSPETQARLRERQRDEYGGIAWGSAFFGFLAAAGLGAILTGIITGAGAAVGLTDLKDSTGASNETVGLAGGIALLVVMAIAYFAGGYVAGRMARFDGARNGFASWAWGIVIAILVAAAAAVFGSKYNVLDQLNLPRIPVDEGTLTTGGLITLAAVLLVTLGAAILGGKAGERFHRKVDRVATEERF